MRAITDFADLAVLLPLALCIAGGLAIGWRRGALAWCAAVGAVLVAILFLKLAFLGCGSTRAFSPSGHTATGTMIYGGIAALWLRQRLGWALACLVAGGAMAALIGTTRVALGMHTGLEAVLGGLVGCAGIALLLRAAGPAPEGMRFFRLTFLAVPLILALHGFRLQVEPHLRHAANWLPWVICGPEKSAGGRPHPVAAAAEPGVT